jgi:hypothetical protein
MITLSEQPPWLTDYKKAKWALDTLKKLITFTK